ncbi:uncharacterized protein PHALS_04504 [Plasmopara halstedii]|uniref:Uncharacterized protein n=1 Tax=Plasmopara halstedii TaxID=4781 RepID=A0A0P1A8P5_PLAHL|nr:uncharacterized protein PHALS_04504 [Plasmopara halstedii]CEG37040.1 hypothetical protein PHALS_04504 [Plasmopara halstedii]|eukprot:XP_024573409.1 hypothetical protein PHALS_04504 [Plasmopara halstedii]
MVLLTLMLDTACMKKTVDSGSKAITTQIFELLQVMSPTITQLLFGLAGFSLPEIVTQSGVSLGSSLLEPNS